MLDMAAAYSTFANRGVHNAPTLLQKIEQVDRRQRGPGRGAAHPDRRAGPDEQEADLVTYCLRQVV